MQEARNMPVALRHEDTAAMQVAILHAAAAADAPEAVAAALAAGLAGGELARRMHLSELRQLFSGNTALLWRLKACQGMLGSAYVCPVSLAAALGHHRALAALLAAGVPLGGGDASHPPSWHSLAAAAISAEAAGWCAGSGWDAAAVDAAEGAAVESCRLLLQAGADVAEAVSCHSAGSHWLLSVDSQPLLRLLLDEAADRCARGWRPRYDAARTLLLAAATADAPSAYHAFAAVLPSGCVPSEYWLLAGEAVALACRSGCLVLRCMAQQAATARGAAAVGAIAVPAEAGQEGDAAALAAATPVKPAQAGGAAAPLPAATAPTDSLAAHLAAELAACLEAAATDGELHQLSVLLEAGMRPTAAAVRAAVISGCMGALALLLRDGAPPVEPLPPGTVLVLPSGGAAAGAGSAPAYTCPLLTLLHAQEVRGSGRLHCAAVMPVSACSK